MTKCFFCGKEIQFFMARIPIPGLSQEVACIKCHNKAFPFYDKEDDIMKDWRPKDARLDRV